MRYVAKKGQNGWMVWDTTTGSCATVSEIAMDELSERTAEVFAKQFNEENPTPASQKRTLN